ncbi:ADP-ribosylglycohydrolase family protein [uncultured Megasphaera sp.]|uniref:ADP-ribosylglycohydrolase family protein n=1 Tax=uncultured Megasphaera sp. TaxID=165188 RepID=UPI002658753E|nr:ADP-ribosylglycohydrolase family protein [uncultured Megasphaera sp.]
MDGAERFAGCMLGGAAGDALGYLLAPLSLYRIRKKYGPYGLRTVLKLESNGKQGVIADNTQMTLFTADGLLWADHDGLTPQEGLYRSYMRWYYTQTERIIQPFQTAWMHRQAHEEQYDYDMMAAAYLFFRRGPGKACLVSLAAGHPFTAVWQANRCRSSSVLRTAPAGLRYQGDPEKAFAVGEEAAVLTHGSPNAAMAAGALSAMTALLVQGQAMETALNEVVSLLRRHDGGEKLADSLLQTAGDAVSGGDPVQAMKRIGLGWDAVEALLLSVYCVMHGQTLKDAVILACNQDGNSDACGAVTGNLAGALYGEQAVPRSWLSGLDGAAMARHLSQCLYERSLA